VVKHSALRIITGDKVGAHKLGVRENVDEAMSHFDLHELGRAM